MFLYCCNIKCCAKCCCLIANDKTDVNIFTAIISGKLHVAKQKTKLTDLIGQKIYLITLLGKYLLFNS